MNKAFKIIWNAVRGNYVVASEMQRSHGKPSRTKTLTTLAVAGALAFSAGVSAKTITNDNIGQEGTTKLVSGEGELNIETAGDLRQLATAIASGDFKKIREALGVGQNASGSTVTLVGVAGGNQYMDDQGKGFLTLASLGLNIKGEKDLAKAISRINAKLKSAKNVDNPIYQQNGTRIVVGADNKTPLILGLTGSDNVFNLGYDSGSSSFHSLDVVRTGNSEITVHSGNLFGVTGGSLAFNVNGPVAHATFLGQSIKAPLTAPSTTSKVEGDVSISLQGTTTSSAIFTGGTALAMGGEATSDVSGSSTLTIGTKASPVGYEGMTLGAFGGGLSMSMLGGESSTTVNGATTVKITDGMVAGVFGGGSAMTAEFDGVWARLEGFLEDYAKNISWGENKELLNFAGTAVTSSQNIELTVGGNAQTAGLVGGGLALASAGTNQAKANTTATTGNVTITLGDQGGQSISDSEKEKLVSGLNEVRQLAQKLTSGGLLDLAGSLAGAQDTLTKLVAPNAHVGTIGGGLAIARTNPGLSKESGAESHATASSGVVRLHMQSGYNVGTMAGGVALAQGALKAADAVKAESTVDSTNVVVSGGENVLLMGGGGAYATGQNGQESAVKAETTVGSATLTVIGGSVDGLYGGGMAIDDTNSSTANAFANTDKVTIAVGQKGVVNAANTQVIMALAKGNPADGTQPPSNGSYAHESAQLAKDANVAILGGGVATGAKATAATNGDILISLQDGGVVNGNVFGGGAATLGGISTVGTSEITVNGSTVNGNIYGGGLAGSDNNNAFRGDDYKAASSTVTEATINLLSGTVTGEVFAGGFVNAKNSDDASSVVTTGTINVLSADVFQGKKLSGDNAQTANLNFGAFSKDFDDTITISGFTTITGAGGDLSNLEFAYGDKTEISITNGAFSFTKVTDGSDNKTLKVGAASSPTVVTFADSKNAGTIKVASGSSLGLGDGADLLAQTKNAGSLTGKTPTIFTSGNVSLTGTAILANADSGAAGSLVINNGTLVVDAAGKTNINNGTVTLDKDSVLYFHNVGQNLAAGETEQKGYLQLTQDATTVKVDNIFWKYTQETDSYVLSQKTQDEIASSTGITNLGLIEFYNRLPNDSSLKGRIDQDLYRGEANLEAGMNLAAAAGVQAAAMQGVGLAIDAAQKRASLSQTFVDGVTGFAEVSGTRLDLGGNASMNEINADLQGVIVGGEWTGNDITVGALANVGTGSVRGQSDNAGVKNDVNYYGASVYAGKRFGSFNIVGQAGYLRTDNDLTDSSIGYAKADGVKTNVWTVGVRGEAAVPLYEHSKLIPYVGINYVRLNTDDYNVSNGTHVSATHQNLWTVPVGVMFTGTLASSSGWNFQPLLDVAYVGSYGDRDVEATTTWGSTVGSVNMDVWSQNVVRSRVGLEANKGPVTFGIQGGAAFGSDNMSSFFGQLSARYNF